MAQARCLSRWPRAAAARSLAAAAACYPDLGPTPLPIEQPGPHSLALAIQRTALDRWLTLEYLLNRFLKQPVEALEPSLRGVLLAAAAQLVFLDRQPHHAVVSEAVDLARILVRPGACGLVNAVLRRLTELVGPAVRDRAWSPAPDRLPLANGFIPLAEPCLPAVETWAKHMSIATSHPARLVAQWDRTFGRRHTLHLCLHSLQTPPAIVAAEPQMDWTLTRGQAVPHDTAGFALWCGSRDELVRFLAGHPDRRVQDPGTAEPIRVLATMIEPSTVVDLCAGRGTKSVQLAAAFPAARLIASDRSPERMEALRRRLAGRTGAEVVAQDQVAAAVAGHGADLIVLDVPCSNTAVLARRPEARYRWSRRTLSGLIGRQRKIVRHALALAAPGAAILYITCSLDRSENRNQIAWMTDRLPLAVRRADQRLPEGQGPSYRDGCFFALLEVAKQAAGVRPAGPAAPRSG